MFYSQMKKYFRAQTEQQIAELVLILQCIDRTEFCFAFNPSTRKTGLHFVNAQAFK